MKLLILVSTLLIFFRFSGARADTYGIALPEESGIGVTIGYAINEDLTIGEPIEFVSARRAEFSVPGLPAECFRPPGITKIGDFEPESARDAWSALTYSGVLFGMAGLECSSVEVEVNLYPTYRIFNSEDGSLLIPTSILSPIPNSLSLRFLRAHYRFKNEFIYRDGELQTEGDCIGWRQLPENTNRRIYCIRSGHFLAAYIFTGDGRREYFEQQRDYIMELMGDGGLSSGDVLGHPAIIMNLGPVSAETLLSDLGDLDRMSHSFYLRVLDTIVASIDESLDVGERFARELQ